MLPGTLLGPYEIVAAIGRGGMGAVYRARDTRLQRQVAIYDVDTLVTQMDAGVGTMWARRDHAGLP